MARFFRFACLLAACSFLGCGRSDAGPDLAQIRVVDLRTVATVMAGQLAPIEIDLVNEGEREVWLWRASVDSVPAGVITGGGAVDGLPALALGVTTATVDATVAVDAVEQSVVVEPRITVIDGQSGALTDADTSAGPWPVSIASCSPVARASARCDGGDLYWYDGCNTRGEMKANCGGVGCIDDACVTAGPCPAGMVQLGSQSVCVDAYEATVYANANCSGPAFGQGSLDDYPTGFPDDVESTGCGGECVGIPVVPETTPAFACSVGGVLPSANITWFQARRACENAGKRLCAASEQHDACGGPTGSSYPYAGGYDPDACNGRHHGVDATVPTGSMPGCEGGYSGLFDMLFNVWEWVDTCSPPDCFARAGGFNQINDGYGVCGGTLSLRPDFDDRDFGFRCCLSL